MRASCDEVQKSHKSGADACTARKHEGREAGDESEGLENDGSYPALPGPLQVHDELAVGAPRQAILRDRRSCHVTAQALQGGAIVGGDEHVSVEFEAAWAPSAQRFVGPFAALGFGSLLALDARELARRDFGALDEKCDIFQAGAGTGGSPTIEDALHPLLNRQDKGLDVVVGRRWQAVKAHGLARCPALSLALRLLASRVGRFTEDSLGHERSRPP